MRCNYRGYELISSPPPSSGGTAICQILNIVEGYHRRSWASIRRPACIVMAEAMRHAFVDRNFLLGDPDFVNNPLERLLSRPTRR